MFNNVFHLKSLCGIICLFVFILNTNNKLFAQYSLVLEEVPLSPNQFSKKLAPGKVLLVFRSSEQLSFDSSVENLEPAEYSDGLYFVELSSGSHAFSVIFNDVPTYLNFGQQMDANSLPPLKDGEVKYYSVRVKAELEWSDITENERKRGTFIIPFGPNVSDAMLVVRLFPSDLELEIKESNNLISKLEKEGSSYNVYIKMPSDEKIENYKLVFSSSETDDLIVTLPRFEPKSVKFIRIRKPLIESLTEAETPAQTPKNKPNFGKNVLGFWAGSLGENKTYIDFSQLDEVKKSVTGKIFSTGIYREFRGIIRFKSIDDYQMSLYLAKDELFSNGAKIDLSYKSGVLNGLWIDDSGQIIDISAMRSSSIQTDNSEEIKQKIIEVNNQLSGSWKTKVQNEFFDILVIGKFNANLETEIHFFKHGNKLNTIDSRILNRNGAFTLIATNFKFMGIADPLTFSMTLKGSEANSTLISDNGKFTKNIKLEKNIGVYSISNPRDFDKIKNLFVKTIEGIASERPHGNLSFEYKISFSKMGKNESGFLFKERLDDGFQNKLKEAEVQARISPSRIGNMYILSTDSISVNLSWKSSKEKIRYTFKSPQSLANNFKALNLSYGSYKTDVKAKELNGLTFYDQRITKYYTRGPITAVNSMLLPGWGTRRVTYSEKSGWGRFAMVAVPLLTSFTFEMMSRNNFNNYRQTDVSIEGNMADSYYNKANSQRRASLVFAGVGTAAYVFDVSWVINQGIKNKKNKKRVNDLINQEDGLYLRRQPLKL